MKKNIFFTLLILNSLITIILFPCPYEFSTDDKRPFFEQYDMEINTSAQQEKDNS